MTIQKALQSSIEQCYDICWGCLHYYQEKKMPIHKGQATREILLAELVKGICKITFIKRDGSARVAFCTLNSLLIPANFAESIQKIFLEDANPDIIPFWEVSQGKWKSFYINSLEIFIPANELNKNITGVQVSQKDDIDGKTDADEIQDIDDNQTDKIESSQKKSNAKIDQQRKEKTVDPVNRSNIKKKGHRRNTKTSITEEMENKKKNLENARHIINTLRMQAQARKNRG